jgi:hypothetical protein
VKRGTGLGVRGSMFKLPYLNAHMPPYRFMIGNFGQGRSSSSLELRVTSND